MVSLQMWDVSIVDVHRCMLVQQKEGHMVRAYELHREIEEFFQCLHFDSAN